MKETWRDVPGYDGKYQLDIEGNCRRVYPSGKTKIKKSWRKSTMQGSKRLLISLTKDGKKKDWILMRLMALTFLGPCPEGCVPYHKNGIQHENHINNIGYINKRELGKKTGASSRRQPVAKIDCTGQIVEVYSSAREAARKNYMSRQTVTDRCNGRCKSAFAPDGYAYAWDDKEVSMRKALRKIELANGYMPKAPESQSEW